MHLEGEHQYDQTDEQIVSELRDREKRERERFAMKRRIFFFRSDRRQTETAKKSRARGEAERESNIDKMHSTNHFHLLVIEQMNP
jgi:hypothetical protein